MSPRRKREAGRRRQVRNSPRNGSRPRGSAWVPSRTAVAAGVSARQPKLERKGSLTEGVPTHCCWRRTLESAIARTISGWVWRVRSVPCESTQSALRTADRAERPRMRSHEAPFARATSSRRQEARACLRVRHPGVPSETRASRRSCKKNLRQDCARSLAFWWQLRFARLSSLLASASPVQKADWSPRHCARCQRCVQLVATPSPCWTMRRQKSILSWQVWSQGDQGTPPAWSGRTCEAMSVRMLQEQLV